MSGREKTVEAYIAEESTLMSVAEAEEFLALSFACACSGPPSDAPNGSPCSCRLAALIAQRVVSSSASPQSR